MSSNAPPPVESFVQQADLSDEPTSPTATAPGPPLFVLQAIANTDALRRVPTTVVCPGCNTAVATYQHGLPDRLIRFREACPACDLELRRWSVVALPTSLVDATPTEALAATTHQYWDEHIWAGATTSGHPRNEEFTRAYTERAAAYGWEWTVRCPLCRRSLEDLAATRLDYHHWTRPPAPDRGVCLCRQCHEAVNAGQYDRDLDWAARKLGFGGQHHLQLARLAARETIVANHTAIEPLARTLSQRYNAPYTAAYLGRLIETAFRDEDARAALDDEYLHAGVPTDA